MSFIEYLPVIFGLFVPVMFFFSYVQSSLMKPKYIWRFAHINGLIALGSSVALAIFMALQGRSEFAHPWVNVTQLTPVILITISIVAFVVLRFSQNYMQGEPRQEKFSGMLQLTFAAASMVVLSNHLLVLLLVWFIVSLSMHQLLLFYPDRPRAVLAAHKKFIFARLAEISLLTAFILLYLEHGTWLISDILNTYTAGTILNLQENISVCLIALAVLIKCAQLPVHGWLIQVVEAPTPVSAALHGGVINMGGILLISFAPLFALSSAAQWLVLVVAGVSVFIAALVMTTRVSIKVRLAWSTSAQMGLMLIECALGLYELALLHLVAHSFYKAYSFLNSGNAVNQTIIARSAVERPPSLFQWGIMGVLLATIAIITVMFVNQNAIQLQWFISPWVLLFLSALMFVVQRNSGHNQLNIISQLMFASGIVVAYATLKYTSFSLLNPVEHTYSIWADLWVSLMFVGLFVAGYIQRYQLHQKWVSACNLVLYSGLYIDEWSSRITLAIWPKAMPQRVNAKRITESHEESLL